jgi:molybdate transport system substrate-binding protein
MLDAMTPDPAFGPPFKAAFLGNVKSREENVKAVVSKVRLGEVDAGIVYVTDVGGDAAKELGGLPVPDRFNQIADYPLAVTAAAAQPALAQKFVAFVLSPEGQQIMSRYGFIPAPQAFASVRARVPAVGD